MTDRKVDSQRTNAEMTLRAGQAANGLHQLVRKALERMDAIQKMTDETFALLKACLEKMGDVKT